MNRELDTYITLLINKSDKEKLTSIAEANGLGLAPYIRNILLKRLQEVPVY